MPIRGVRMHPEREGPVDLSRFGQLDHVRAPQTPRKDPLGASLPGRQVA